MPDWIFDGWWSLGRTVVAGVATYAALIAFIRIAGKRTLSSMNAFDLVVTVAIGSVFASVILNRDVPLAEGIVALAMLIGLQFAVAYASVRWRSVADVVKSEPTLLVRGGEPLHAAMRRERVALVEIEQAAREAGLGRVADVDAMVLETDGSFSVTRRVPTPQRGIEVPDREG